jgi:hypothetical protein
LTSPAIFRTSALARRLLEPDPKLPYAVTAIPEADGGTGKSDEVGKERDLYP